MNRSALLATIGAFAAAAPHSAGAQTPAIRVGAVPVDISAQAFYAKDMGFLRKAGVDIDITQMSNGGAAIQAAIAGAIDIAFTGVLEVMAARERGITLAILAPANTYVSTAPSAAILGVLAAGPIRSAADLSGKTVACNPLRGSTWLGCRSWIDQNGGDSSKVSFLEMPLPTMPDAVKSGRVDAALFDSLNANTMGKPGDPLRLLANAFDGISHDFMPAVWVSSVDWRTKNADAARRFGNAMRETSIWANSHHDASAEILARYTKFTVAQLKGLTRATYGVDLTAAAIQPLIDAAAKYGVIAKSVPARELYANTPVR